MSGTAPGYWLGFDLGGTKMLATVFDSDFSSVGRKRKKTKAYRGQETGLARMVQTARKAIEDAGIMPSQLQGIGVGSPGPLDLNEGVILDTPNLGWRNAPLKATLEAEFGCPAVIMNDVDAGVYGEYRFGAGQGARCLLGVFPGTGIGGGCVYDGTILRGRVNSILEIGHMQVQPEGPLCGCGRRGCLEAVASRLAIASAAAAAAYRGEAPHLLENSGMDLSNIRSGALADAVTNGDSAVETIVRQAAAWLGVGIGNTVNLLGPDVVVLGGGLVEALPELFLEEVTQSAKACVMPVFESTFDVRVSRLTDDATVAGAAAWAQEEIGTG